MVDQYSQLMSYIGRVRNGHISRDKFSKQLLWALGVLGVRVLSDRKRWGQRPPRALSPAVPPPPAARPGRAPRMPGAVGRVRPLERPRRGRPRASLERGPGSRSAAGGPGNAGPARELGTPQGLAGLAGSPHCEGRRGGLTVLCRLPDRPLGEGRGFLQCSGALPFLVTVGGPNQRVCAEAARSVEQVPRREGSSQLPRQPLFISNCGRRSSFSQRFQIRAVS